MTSRRKFFGLSSAAVGFAFGGRRAPMTSFAGQQGADELLPTISHAKSVASQSGERVNVKDYGARGDGVTDDTSAINAAISAIPAGGVVYFPSATYVIGSVATITKPIILDFGGSFLKPNTTGIMFQYQVANPDAFANALVMRDGTVVPGPQVPSDLVKILYGGINPLIENFNVQGPAYPALTATHALIWNRASYGLQLTNCKFRNSTVPYAVYCSHSDSDPLVFSNAISIDHIDLSNIGGVGIYFEGGTGAIRGASVIEGCSRGGIQHGNEAYANSLLISDTHFEQNSAFDISFGMSGGHYTVKACALLSMGITDHIHMTSATVLTTEGNTFYSGGVAGSAPISYVGINNIQRANVSGYTGTFDAEIADTIRGGIQAVLINRSNIAQAVIARGSSVNIIPAQPLTGTAYDEWRIVGYSNGNYGFGEVVRVFVSRVNGGITGVAIVDHQEAGYASIVTVEGSAKTYAIHIVNGGVSPVTYYASYVGNTRLD